MRKLSSMLALGLALAMTLGMTVGAAPSISTANPNVTNDVLTAIAEDVKPSEGVTVAPIDVTEFDEMYNSLATDKVGNVLDNSDITDVKEFVNVFKLSGTPGKITLSNVGKISSDKTYVMLHWKDNGDFEVLDVTVNGSSITFNVDSFSTFALFEVVKAGDDDDDDDDDDDTTPAVTAAGAPASPKTGETVPVAGVMAVICLAGVVVCAKKVRYNK